MSISNVQSRGAIAREPKLRVVNMPSNAVDDRLLSVEEVAAYLNLAVGTIYNRVSRNEIPHVKLGRSVRFRRTDIDAWVESQASTPNDAADPAA